MCFDGILFPFLFMGLSPEFVDIVLGGVKGKFITAIAFSLPMLLFLFVYRARFASYAEQPLELKNLRLMSRNRLVEEVERTRTYLEMNRNELQEVLQRLSIATRSANIGIWEWDETSKKLIWDAKMREIYGVDATVSDIHLPVWQDMLHPDDVDAALVLLNRSTSLNGVASARLRVRIADGDVRHMQVYANQHVDQHGNLVKIVGVSWDVTEQVQLQANNAELQAQYYQSQKMESIGLLAGGIAHDFNNLLVPIMGYADLVMMSLEPDSTIHADVQQIRTSADRAAGLTKQILAFSRQQVLEVVDLNLNELVVEFSEILGRLIGEHIEFSTKLDPRIPQVRGGKSQLEQVVLNLVVNARDAMRSGGSISVETTSINLDSTYVGSHSGATPGLNVMLSVSDTGSGMKPELQERIFEPFFSTKTEGGGTGLGLATVFGIVKQHKGSISVHSEPGKGTTFKVYLPVLAASSTLASIEEIETGTLNGMETILVVEDEDAVRFLVSDTLRAHGYQILETADVGICKELIESCDSTVALLLTDMIMPVMNGNELYEKLRFDFPDLGVLYMSGYTGEGVLDDNKSIDHKHYLQKPFAIRTLLSKVREVLDQRDQVDKDVYDKSPVTQP